MPDREMIKESIIRAVRNGANNEELRLVIDELLREQVRTGWISVTERMPEEEGEYIAFDGETVFGAYYEIGTSGAKWTDATEGYYDFKVTRWRQMPEPPEEVRGDG